jgi:hypothetical protein
LPQTLRSLIDEQLQLQEAKRKENELTPAQMEGLEHVRQGVY